jgi:hypothetical protein
MVEPFSILGAIGTTAGLIGFLATTLGAVHKKVNEARRVTIKLESWRLRIKSVEKRFKDWSDLWLEPSSRSLDKDNELYTYLWGKDDYAGILSQLENFKQFNEVIQSEVLRKTSPSNSSRKKLRQCFVRDDPALNEQECNQLAQDEFGGSLSIIVRTWITVWDTPVLDDNVKQLEEEIKRLEDESKAQFFRARGEPQNAALITSDRVRKVLNSYRQYDRLNKMFVPLLNSHLVLGHPSLEDAVSYFEADNGINYQVLTEHDSSFDMMTFTSGVVRPQNNENIPTSECGIDGKKEDIKGFLRRIRHDPAAQEKYRYELIAMTIKLANSICIFNKTAWKDHLCLCRIRVLKRGHEGQICIFRGRENQFCHLSALKENVFWNLAMAIAELIIAEPMEHLSEINPTVESELRERVLKRSSLSCEMAIVQCLSYSRKFGLRGNAAFQGSETRNAEFQVDELSRCIEKIVRP